MECFYWVCNECGAHEFTDCITEKDLEYLACTSCGGVEFHREKMIFGNPKLPPDLIF